MAKFRAGILSGIAFQPRPKHILASDDSVFSGYPENYAIDIYSPDGRKTRTIRKEYDPIRITDKDKEYFATSIARPFLTRGGLPQSKEEIKDVLFRF